MTASALVALCLSAAGVAYLAAFTLMLWNSHAQNWHRRR